MSSRVYIILNDVNAARKLKKFLNFLEYGDVEILSQDAYDPDLIIRSSPELVIVGSSVALGANDLSFIQKAHALDLPVIYLSRGAEHHFQSLTLKKMLEKISTGLRPLHAYLIEDIVKKNDLLNRDFDNTILETLKNEDSAFILLKELKCLYFISDVMSIPDLSVDAVLRYVHQNIEKTISFDENAKVRITYLNKVFESDNFRESRLKIECPIFVDKREVGEIEVFYDADSCSNKDYLLKMENDLINSVSERIGNYIKGRETIRELENTNEELRRLSSHLQSVREDERKMVVGTIHDEFGQKLTTLKFEALTLKNKLLDGEQLLGSDVESMVELIDASIGTVRKLATDLRPGVLDKLGISAAIEWLARDIENRTGIKFTVVCSPDDLTLNDDYTTALFRIFQESTTNIIRHSQATEAIVNLKISGDNVLLIVLDNGKGISENSLNSGDSFGIKGMKERVHTFRGIFSLTSNNGQGTVLKVSLPLGNTKMQT
jgi:signal transduction histidine kinase